MPIINLRDFYPFYTRDEFVDVPDAVAEALADAERLEQNYLRRVFYNKSQYSLDAGDGIEASAVECTSMSPEAMLDLMERHCRLCRALNSLPDIQGRRVEAHYLLGRSQREIAGAEGVSLNSVSLSLKRGLRAIRKLLKNFR
jgi:RNA polymerase sigma-70 factor (ECF subfamily)